MFDREKKLLDYNHFWGFYIFIFTSLYFEQLIIQNKTSSPKDFELKIFNCIWKPKKIWNIGQL